MGAAAHHHHDDNLPAERLPSYKVLDDNTIEVTVPPYFDAEDGEEWEIFTAYDRKEDLPNERRFKLCLKGPEMPRKFLTPISQKDMDVSMVNDRSLYTKAVVPVLAESLEWLLECPAPVHTFDEQPVSSYNISCNDDVCLVLCGSGALESP